MRTPASVAACLLLVGSLGAWAQAAKFAGTWEAAHEGKVFLVLKVEAGQRISGTLNAGSITLSDEGDPRLTTVMGVARALGVTFTATLTPSPI